MKTIPRTPQYLNWQRFRAGLLIGMAPALALTPQFSLAQGPVLEEVTVTATRRGDTDIMKTAVAVTALTASDIEAFSPRDLNDIAVMVPSLSAGTVSAFKSASFAMRGVSETTIIVYKESPVGVIIDDFVVNHVQTQNLEMFDIEQIEVLRGPQGTLFGKNTTGGTINIKTKRPDHEVRNAELRYEFGDFGTQKITGALNVPLIEDTLSFRFAGQWLESDGYYENNASYGPLTIAPGLAAPGGAIDGQTGQGDGGDLGGDDVQSMRLKLLWSPTEDFNALLQYEYIKDQGDTPPVVNESGPGYLFDAWGFTSAGGDPLKDAGITNNDDFLFEMSKGHQIDIEGFYLNMDWTIGDYTLYSVTGQRNQESHLPNTYSGEVFQTLFDATRDDERETFQQEIRLASDLDGPFNFVTGLYYQKEDIDFCVVQVVGFVDLLLDGEPAFLSANPLILCNKQEAEALAVYIDGTYDISDNFHISAGFRYTDEEKEWTGRPRVPIQALPDGGFDPNFTWEELGTPLAGADFERFPDGVVTDKEDWQEPTYRLQFAYDFSEDLFGWAGYSRGFKSGGYNDQTGTVLNPIPAVAARPTDPEIADSFEVGVKSILAGGAANIQVTGFYVEYKDAQRTFNATFPTGQETLFFNAAELEVMGIELEGSWAITDSLVLRGNAMWQDAEFNEFRADTDFDGIDDIDLSGKPPTRTPEWMGALDAIYTWDLDMGDVDFNLRVSYEDESVAGYSDVDESYDTTLNSRTVWDAGVTFKHSSDKWWVRGFAKNFTDERYRTGSLSVGNFWIMSAYAPPEYYGMELGVNIDF
ncbi:TonB-dependent receptor [Halieaceae bacterium IMCC14734]|uniref:TonB-dependent receptor n=1 Tax=Candidatus Litorirhabdus singularis TaxID=2518993 RepID=A0ABT3TKK5_9GAMM|nr:TonB-dependent receptor [Candidatus Litorirhabdus singularis]MCX2982852.1 TonB-dependent receptor [Candidatus Litorirhabdus singularis]